MAVQPKESIPGYLARRNDSRLSQHWGPRRVPFSVLDCIILCEHTKPKGCGGMYNSQDGAVDGCIASAKGVPVKGNWNLEGGAKHRSASSANQRPSSEDGLASPSDATFDTASGRQR